MLAFPKKLRLLSPQHFNYVFQQSQQASYPEITILGRLNELGYPRIGLTIAKKNIKRAHERNRIKRLTREYFRLHQHKLPSMDFVILVRKGLANFNNQEITEILCKLWCRHCRLARGS